MSNVGISSRSTSSADFPSPHSCVSDAFSNYRSASHRRCMGFLLSYLFRMGGSLFLVFFQTWQIIWETKFTRVLHTYHATA